MTNQGSTTYKTPPDATMNKNRRPPLKFYEERDILGRCDSPVRVPSTLRQLTKGSGHGPGGAVTDSFDWSAMPREALRCKGYWGAVNSASTLGQSSRVRATLRHGLQARVE